MQRCCIFLPEFIWIHHIGDSKKQSSFWSLSQIYSAEEATFSFLHDFLQPITTGKQFDVVLVVIFAFD